MEALLEQITSESSFTPNKSGFSSYYFQPERLLISSEQAPDNQSASVNFQEQEYFSDFTVRLPRPALDVKSIQLVRASIPNAVPNIPDTETTFWYYKVPVSVINLGQPITADYLHYIRLLPTTYKPELNAASSQYGFNRTFYDYQDLAAELAKSCAADPYYDAQPTTTWFIPNDISITYNEALNKFIFKGNDAFTSGPTPTLQFYYISAGYLDPQIWDTTPAPLQLSAVSLQGETAIDDGFGLGTPGQPFQINKTLNLRLGFTWNGLGLQEYLSTNSAVFMRFRPNLLIIPTPLWNWESTSYTAESYANLVYTNCVNVYCDLITGATVDSDRNTQLLAAVPMNASNLGVGFYNPVINNPLTKIVSQIYEITILLRTDTGLPYYLPNNAIVSLEISLSY
jgi:hypothetical protein